MSDPPSATVVFAAIDALRAAVTARSDCVAGDVPVGRWEPEGLLVSVVSTTAGDPGRGDVTAKPEPYFHLRSITPRAVTVSLTGGRPGGSHDLPVYIRGVVRRGERGGVTPSASGGC